jgi:hypothetical protein
MSSGFVRGQAAGLVLGPGRIGTPPIRGTSEIPPKHDMRASWTVAKSQLPAGRLPPPAAGSRLATPSLCR